MKQKLYYEYVDVDDDEEEEEEIYVPCLDKIVETYQGNGMATYNGKTIWISDLASKMADELVIHDYVNNNGDANVDESTKAIFKEAIIEKIMSSKVNEQIEFKNIYGNPNKTLVLINLKLPQLHAGKGYCFREWYFLVRVIIKSKTEIEIRELPKEIYEATQNK